MSVLCVGGSSKTVGSGVSEGWQRWGCGLFGQGVGVCVGIV